jgi:hypothetical protein
VVDVVPLDPPDVLVVLVVVVVVVVVLLETTLLVVPVVLLDEELPAVSDVELPVSCTPSAKAVKLELPTEPTCESAGAVGLVMLDCFVFTAALSTAGSVELMIPAPL